MSQITFHRHRKNQFLLDLNGIDVGGDGFVCHIRTEPNQDSPLIASLNSTFVTDGADGLVLFTLSELDASQVTANSGYMDIKRTTVEGDAVVVVDQPIEVRFQGTVTA